MEGLKKTVITNLKGRHADPSRSSDALDGQMLWILWRHIRRTDRRAVFFFIFCYYLICIFFFFTLLFFNYFVNAETRKRASEK